MTPSLAGIPGLTELPARPVQGQYRTEMISGGRRQPGHGQFHPASRSSRVAQGSHQVSPCTWEEGAASWERRPTEQGCGHSTDHGKLLGSSIKGHLAGLHACAQATPHPMEKGAEKSLTQPGTPDYWHFPRTDESDFLPLGTSGFETDSPD